MYSNVCLKKQNGNTICEELALLTDHGYVISKQDNCFNNAFLEHKYNGKLKKLFGPLIRSLSSNIVLDSEFSNNILNLLNQAHCFDQLDDVANLLIEKYEEIIEEKVDSFYEYSTSFDYKTALESKNLLDDMKSLKQQELINRKTIVSIIIKQFIYSYFSNKVSDLCLEEYNEVANAKIEKNYDGILKYLSLSGLSEEIKEYALNVILEEIDKAYVKPSEHLCWENCKYANPLQCRKVFDKVKRPINEYDFIDSGYQTYNNNGVVTQMIVSKCANYERSNGEGLSSKVIEELRKSLKQRFDQEQSKTKVLRK